MEKKLSCGEISVQLTGFYCNLCRFVAKSVIHAVLSRNFCHNLHAFMWRKVEPKSTFVEKKCQIWGLVCNKTDIFSNDGSMAGVIVEFWNCGTIIIRKYGNHMSLIISTIHDLSVKVGLPWRHCRLCIWWAYISHYLHVALIRIFVPCAISNPLLKPKKLTLQQPKMDYKWGE